MRFGRGIVCLAVVVAAATVTTAARADDEATTTTTVNRRERVTTTTQVPPRSTTTAAEPVRPLTAEELAAQAQAPQDPDEQVATEEAPEYVGPPLPRVDLTQSTFDPKAQPAFAAYAAARAELDALQAAEQARLTTTTNSAASVVAAQQAVSNAQREMRERSTAMRNLAVHAYMSDADTQLPREGRAGYFSRLARKVMADGLRRDQKKVAQRQQELSDAVAADAAVRAQSTAGDGAITAAQNKVDALDAALRLFAVGATGVPVGFRFPINAPYSFGDSWGAPRMVGTQYFHAHEGTDVFAAFGSPLVAVEDGVVQKVGRDTLGGMKLWLVGSHSGNRYYYAHLSAFADGLTSGMPVSAGQFLGKVGDSGNAKGGPAHLHFEIHPAGFKAVNPYPLLKVAASGDPNSKRK